MRPDVHPTEPDRRHDPREEGSRGPRELLGRDERERGRHGGMAEGLPRAARPVLAAIVGTVGFGRMYVGAHLPHDVVGGAGLGMMISAAIPPADGG